MHPTIRHALRVRAVQEEAFRAPQEEDSVLVQPKDLAYPGDATQPDRLARSAITVSLTANVLQLLKRRGIPVAFLEQVDATTIRAKPVVQDLPIVTVRRYATETYQKRHPNVPKGFRFAPPIVEWFLNDVEKGMPRMVYDFGTGEILLYDAAQPLGSVLLGTLPLPDPQRTPDRLRDASRTAQWAFELLETAWATEKMELVELSLPFGVTVDGKVAITGFLDEHAWQLRLPEKRTKLFGGDQVATASFFRKASEIVQQNREWMLAATERFLRNKSL